MADLDKTNNPKRVSRFQYNPEAVDVCVMNHILFDLLHFKLLCKQAQDMGISVNHLIGMIFEKYLVNTGYLDPKAPSTEGYKPAVTLRNIRENPKHLANFLPNSLVSDKFAGNSFGFKLEPTEEQTGSEFWDEDGLDYKDFK